MQHNVLLFISILFFSPFAVAASSPAASPTASSLSVASPSPSTTTDAKGETAQVYPLGVLSVDHQAVSTQQVFPMSIPLPLSRFLSPSPGGDGATRKTKAVRQANGTDSGEDELVCSVPRTVICPHGKHCCPDLGVCCDDGCCPNQFPLCGDPKRRLCFNGLNQTLCRSAGADSQVFLGTLCTNGGCCRADSEYPYCPSSDLPLCVNGDGYYPCQFNNQVRPGIICQSSSENEPSLGRCCPFPMKCCGNNCCFATSGDQSQFSGGPVPLETVIYSYEPGLPPVGVTPSTSPVFPSRPPSDIDFVATVLPEVSATRSPSASASLSPAPCESPSSSSSSSMTYSMTPTASSYTSATMDSTATASVVASMSSTAKSSVSTTASASATASTSKTASVSATASASATASISKSASANKSASVSASQSATKNPSVTPADPSSSRDPIVETESATPSTSYIKPSVTPIMQPSSDASTSWSPEPSEATPVCSCTCQLPTTPTPTMSNMTPVVSTMTWAPISSIMTWAPVSSIMTWSPISSIITWSPITSTMVSTDSTESPPPPPNSVFPTAPPILECFPGSARVEVASHTSASASSKVQTTIWRSTSMDRVETGDIIRSGPQERDSSRVFLWTHRQSSCTSCSKPKLFLFIRLTVSSGKSLTASRGHLVYVCSHGGSRRTMAMQDVVVGTHMLCGVPNSTKDPIPIMVVKKEQVFDRGLYNPHTASGDIVVDGFLSSCYTTAIDNVGHVAHGLLTPIRALAQSFFLLTEQTADLNRKVSFQ